MPTHARNIPAFRDTIHFFNKPSLQRRAVDWESNGGLVKKLPSIREDEEVDDDQISVMRSPRSPRSLLRLTRGLNSPLRSPLLPPRPFRSPSEQSRPSTLQIPVVSFCSAPSDLSPRFVDGIETETANSSQRFDFSSSLPHSDPPSPGPGILDQSEIKKSVSKLSDEMSSLSQQVSQLSQELQEMTRLLRPLLLVTPQPTLAAIPPVPTPTHSVASQPSSSIPLVIPPAVLTCSPKPCPKRTHSCLLLDIETVDMSGSLPTCLLPTPPIKTPQAQPQTQSPTTGTADMDVPITYPSSPGTGDTDEPHQLPNGSNHSKPPTSSNGFFSSAQEQHPLTSRTVSLRFSTSCSPCQGNHPSRPSSHSSHSRSLLPPPPSNTPPSSHCSAPPSLNSSPGDRRSKVVSPSSSPPQSCPHTTSLSFGLFSLDSLRGETQGGTGLEANHLEMQEWGGNGRSSTLEHISYIDEDGPAL
ncbi:hypothetical protein DPEC_G00045150 [Dallia pectoralis]|uniref:Uncharacterized protein n=1 Tax=Dallia pectoralis TaxID=75939 RepID=A0ACC2HAA1_DALPE|nr:hypothetical protein DPEC_G00045150 [Dallia pectoralis]